MRVTNLHQIIPKNTYLFSGDEKHKVIGVAMIPNLSIIAKMKK
jgi:hypothetical protein